MVFLPGGGHKQFGAANGSIREMGVLAGVRVEKHEVGGPGEFDHLSDEELEQEIKQRFAELFGDHAIPDAGSDTTRLAISDGSISPNGASRTPKDRDH